MKLRFAPRARSDIDAIHAYIQAVNPRAATAVVLSIRATARLLARHPGLGRATDIAGVSVLPVGRYPYLVYHAVEGDALVIVHVRHGARDAPSVGDL